MNYLAKKLAHLLAEHANDSIFEDEIRYGIEIAIGGLVQMIFIVLVALVLGIWKEVTAIIIAAALYRRYTGGPHCSAYYRCTVTSLIVFISLGFIAGFIPVLYLPVYIICLVLLSSCIIYFYVPVDNPVNRITDESIIKKYKQQSFALLLLMLAIMITGYLLKQNLLVISILLGLLWQNFTLTPPGHAFIDLWDKLFDRIELLLKREEVMKCSE